MRKKTKVDQNLLGSTVETLSNTGIVLITNNTMTHTLNAAVANAYS